MKTIEHFYTLIRAYEPIQVGEPIEVRAHMLATTLHCSKRNVKLLLRQFQENGWIDWTPGIGRGNLSTLTLLKPWKQLLFGEAKKIAEQRSFSAAIQWLANLSNGHELKTAFIQWYVVNIQEEDKEGSGPDRLRFPSYRPLPCLDPAIIYRRTENHFARFLFDTPVTYDSDKNQYVPHLIHHWASDDDQTWRLFIRKGVLFHHGIEMTAGDVCMSLKRHHSRSPYHWISSMISTCHELDRYTVEIKLKYPFPSFLSLLTSLGATVVQTASLSQAHPIGTGPFKVKENTDYRFVIEAHHNYFKSRPLLDGVELYFVPDLYEQQQLHPVSDKDNSNFFHYQYESEKRKDFVETSQLDRCCKMVTINATSVPLPIRQFLRQTLEKEKMIHDLQGTRERAATQLYEGTHIFTPSQEISRAIPGTHLHLLTYEGAGNERDADWLTKEWSRYGVKLTVDILPLVTIYENPKIMKKADLFLTEQLTEEDPLLTYLWLLLSEMSPIFHHMETSVQKDVFKQLSSPRTVLLTHVQAVEKRLLDEAVLLPLYRLRQYAYHPPTLQDVHLNSYGWLDYMKAWFMGR